MKIRLDQILRAFKSIIQKVSILFSDHVIAHLWALWYHELIYNHENLSALIIEGQHVDCEQNVFEGTQF